MPNQIIISSNSIKEVLLLQKMGYENINNISINITGLFYNQLSIKKYISYISLTKITALYKKYPNELIISNTTRIIYKNSILPISQLYSCNNLAYNSKIFTSIYILNKGHVQKIENFSHINSYSSDVLDIDNYLDYYLKKMVFIIDSNIKKLIYRDILLK